MSEASLGQLKNNKNMATKNDITGDSLVTKSATDAFRDGWERIFGKGKKQVAPARDSATLTSEQREALRELTDHIDPSLKRN